MILEMVRRWVVLWWMGLAAILVWFFWFSGGAQHTEKPAKPLSILSALGADLSSTTVSGISSGAYMAGQFQLAHADIVTGIGIIAGGPYGCAQSVFSSAAPDAGAVFLGASRAINGCMQNNLTMWGIPDPSRLVKKAKALALDNRIDSIKNVVSDRVYLFSGAQDDTVKPPIVAAANEFYLKLGVPANNILFVNDANAGHGFVTLDEGSACAVSAIPFIVDCDYDQAGAIFQHLYENLEPPGRTQNGEYVQFNQLDFAPKGSNHGLARTGVVYVPRTCLATPGCKVHIAFHGCGQNRSAVGGAFIKDTGFARWADTNHLLVVFPQVSAGTFNPTGCWDWWGYTGKEYLTREAPQIAAVRAMLDRLAATPGSEFPPSS